MAVDAVPQFLHALRDSTLLTQEQCGELHTLGTQLPDLRALARELVKRGWLTPYQVNQLVRGRGKDLLLGPYHILEPLGEGGMGQVFKARHPLMKRLVALKVIRAERLKSGDALRRFQREIEAAAKLSHPNVVIAHDAQQAGGCLFFVMEYIEGTDLGKLVQKRGALPIGEACEYVRQAALGLQHAHEHGLVHRDIKPSNLLLSRGGVVKVLDMGLARIGAQAPGDSVTALTEEGSMMGTPDYMAPEQASDAHRADIRADIYSLGCTLYALLVARAPFAGGSFAQKIAAHLCSEPQPLEQLRPDVPPALAAVVRRMMAKRPEQRYSTPAETAAALAPFCQPIPGSGQSAISAPVSLVPPRSASSRDTSTVATGSWTEPARLPTAVPTPAPRQLPRWVLPAGAGGTLLLVFLVWLLTLGSRGPGPAGHGGATGGPAAKASPLELDPDGPTIEVRRFAGHRQQVNSVAFSQDGKLAVSGSSDRTVRLWDAKTGEHLHTFEVEKGIWGVSLSADGKHLLGCEGGWWSDEGYKTAPPYSIYLWDVAARKEVRRFQGHQAEITAVAFLPDGRRFLSSAINEGVWLWEGDGDRPSRRVAESAAYGNFPLSGDGRLALFIENDNSLRLWNVADWEAVRVLKGHKDLVRAAALSADGRRALSASYDRAVAVWDVTAGRELRSPAEHPTITSGVAVSADGRWGATGGGTARRPNGQGVTGADFDNVIRLFNLESGQQVRAYSEHTGPILTLTFSPDGRYLLSGSGDGTMRLWRWAK